MADYRSKNEGMFSAYLPSYNIMQQYNQPDNAFVMRGVPNTVFLGADRAKMPDVERALQHEFSHQMEQKALKRYSPNEKGSEMEAVSGYRMQPTDAFFLQALQKGRFGDDNSQAARGSAYKDQQAFQERFASPEVQKRFSALFKNVSPEGRLANPKESPFNEIMADLNAYEMFHKVDATQDPVLRKQLFNNDDRLIEAYRSIAPNRTDRLDAKDLPPYQTQYVEPAPWYQNALQKLGF
jgi:hypothetical protein